MLAAMDFALRESPHGLQAQWQGVWAGYG